MHSANALSEYFISIKPAICQQDVVKVHSCLIRRIAENNASWMSFGNILSLTLFIKNDARQKLCSKDFLKFQSKLKSNFVEIYPFFEEFINEMDGFDDLIDYEQHLTASLRNKSVSNGILNKFVSGFLSVLEYFNKI